MKKRRAKEVGSGRLDREGLAGRRRKGGGKRWLRKGAGKARGGKRGGEEEAEREKDGQRVWAEGRVVEGGEGPAREFPAFAQPHIDPTPV